MHKTRAIAPPLARSPRSKACSTTSMSLHSCTAPTAAKSVIRTLGRNPDAREPKRAMTNPEKSARDSGMASEAPTSEVSKRSPVSGRSGSSGASEGDGATQRTWQDGYSVTVKARPSSSSSDATHEVELWKCARSVSHWPVTSTETIEPLTKMATLLESTAGRTTPMKSSENKGRA